MSRLDREKWRQEVSAKFPHHVDVVPPPTGYSRSEEEDIMDFLESRVTAFPGLREAGCLGLLEGPPGRAQVSENGIGFVW